MKTHRSVAHRMGLQGLRIALALAVAALAGCSTSPAADVSTPEARAALDSYAKALGQAFVAPIEPGGSFDALVVPTKRVALIANANSLASAFIPPRWSTVSTAVDGITCSGGQEVMSCRFVSHIGLATENETADVVQSHSVQLQHSGDRWLVLSDDSTAT